MEQQLSPIEAYREALRRTEFDLAGPLRQALARANANASSNTYITLDPARSLSEAERQFTRSGHTTDKPSLFGLPVSLKDCFDLQGFKTSVGSKFYASHNPIATEDSAVAMRLKQCGAIITGKTHLHQLAYGITGENRDYGNCLQPANAARLTGGSSSGAAASVQEGSALAAIGTDTGGSIRVPAALCGLAGYRSSLGVADWRGGAHLARSFDTIGWLFRDLRDAPLLAESLFDLPPENGSPEPNGHLPRNLTIGVLSEEMLEECDPAVRRSLEFWQTLLQREGFRLTAFRPEFWSGAWDIYQPLQAFEAAKVHQGFFSEFEPAITARLEWGASLKEDEIGNLQVRNEQFRESMDALFRSFDFLLFPATPVSFLDATQDHTQARPRILRFTLPASLAGLPAVVLPSPDCGLQLLAARNDDRRLLRLAAQMGRRLAEDQS